MVLMPKKTKHRKVQKGQKRGISKAGNTYVDTSEFDRLASRVKQAGGDLGAEIAITGCTASIPVKIGQFRKV